jgi:hypothetical protein
MKIQTKKTKDKKRGAGNKSSENSDNSGFKKKHCDSVEASFGEFWEAYPRKVARGDAKKAFERLFPFGQAKERSNRILQEIAKRLEEFLPEAEATKQRGEEKFIPYPASWLNREGFGDD